MLFKYVPKSVPSTSLPKLPSNPSNVSSPSISQYDVCEEYEQKDPIDILPQAPSPPLQPSTDDLEAEINLLRKVYLSSRYRGTQDSLIKHRYNLIAAAQPVDGAPVFTTINAVANGTTPITRLGSSIWNHGLTCRMQANYVPTATATIAVLIPAPFRVIVFRDITPLVYPATYASTYTQAVSNPIVAPSQLYSTLGSGDILAVRNPNTFDKYHVLYDKIINMPVTPISLSATTGTLVGQHLWDIHLDLHDSKTTFWTTTDVSIATNGLMMVLVSDSLAAQGGLISISGTLDFTFSDAPNT